MIDKLRRILWLIIPVNIFGIVMVVFALTGLVRPIILVIPFVFTPALIDPLYRFLRDPRRRETAIAPLIIGIAAVLILAYIALNSMI